MKSMKKIFVALIASLTLCSTQVVLAEATPTTTAEQTQTAVVISDKVNVNTASAAEIQRVLVGIGQKKAEAIVQYREKNGIFTSAEQLMEVQGFGKATFEKNKERILL